MGENMRALFLTAIMMVPLSAFAFHSKTCQSVDGQVTANYVSDATFGAIINASLSYGSISVKYTQFDLPSELQAPNGFPVVQNNIFVVPFKSSESLVFAGLESSITAFDNKGQFLANLKCSP
jgi:hypothetical protein